MESIAALRDITQRVAMQERFDACVEKVEADFAKLNKKGNTLKADVNNAEARIAKINEEKDRLGEEINKLTLLAFSSDVILESWDGTKVPAIKQVLVDSSEVFASMFSGQTTEARDGVVRTDVGAAALRFVSRCVHTSRGGEIADSETLLEACELAERWHLPGTLRQAAVALGDRIDSSTALTLLDSAMRHIEVGSDFTVWKDVLKYATGAVAAVLPAAAEAAIIPGELKSAMAAFGNQIDSSTALKVLASAERHIEGGSDSAVWRDVLEEAAKTVAAGMPAATDAPEFKTLSLESVAQVMLHLQESTYELPELESSLESNSQGGWSEPVSWIKNGKLTTEGGAACEQQFRLRSIISNGKARFTAKIRYELVPTYAKVNLKLLNPDGSCSWKKQTRRRLFNQTSLCWGYSDIAMANYTTNNRFRLSGSVIISKEQRQSELLNLWLLSSEASTAPLQPPAQLQCLRARSCGFDISQADATALTDKLKERGLPTEGQRKTLQTRLRDAMFSELSLSPAVQQVSCSLATLCAEHFSCAAKEGSLLELDAATMSQVLAHRNLRADNEKQVLEHVLDWAVCEGRTAAVVDRVMPLVHFPLVSVTTLMLMVKQSCKLQQLKAKSTVFSELIKEAIKYQFGSTPSNSPVKEHTLLSSTPTDTPQHRTKRRRFCQKDKIPAVDPATAYMELADALAFV